MKEDLKSQHKTLDILIIFIHLCVLNSLIIASPVVLYQAAELAEHTAKITLLEEAKRRKEEEADTWQLRVRALTEGKLQRTVYIQLFLSGGKVRDGHLQQTGTRCYTHKEWN